MGEIMVPVALTFIDTGLWGGEVIFRRTNEKGEENWDFPKDTPWQGFNVTISLSTYMACNADGHYEEVQYDDNGVYSSQDDAAMPVFKRLKDMIVTAICKRLDYADLQIPAIEDADGRRNWYDQTALDVQKFRDARHLLDSCALARVEHFV